MLTTDSDGELLERLALGDDAAFECLFMRHHGPVYRVVYGLVDRRDMAEDVTQETFLELYRQPPILREDATLQAWLCRVALNRCRNLLRGERRSQEREGRVFAEPSLGEYDPEALLLKSEEQARVRDALAQLTERQRTILLLRHAGLSYAEVAQLAVVAAGSVGTMLLRAERAFMEIYKRSGQDADPPSPKGARK
jgi:RNA polymerase sigma-70 factor (ECF subfamily)